MERASSFQAAEPQAAEPQAAVPIATEPQENSEFEQFLKSAMEIARSSESSVSPENGSVSALRNPKKNLKFQRREASCKCSGRNRRAPGGKSRAGI